MAFPLTTPSPGINYNFVSGAYLVCSVILAVLLALDKVISTVPRCSTTLPPLAARITDRLYCRCLRSATAGSIRYPYSLYRCIGVNMYWYIEVVSIGKGRRCIAIQTCQKVETLCLCSCLPCVVWMYSLYVLRSTTRTIPVTGMLYVQHQYQVPGTVVLRFGTTVGCFCRIKSESFQQYVLVYRIHVVLGCCAWRRRRFDSPYVQDWSAQNFVQKDGWSYWSRLRVYIAFRPPGILLEKRHQYTRRSPRAPRRFAFRVRVRWNYRGVMFAENEIKSWEGEGDENAFALTVSAAR